MARAYSRCLVPVQIPASVRIEAALTASQNVVTPRTATTSTMALSAIGAILDWLLRVVAGEEVGVALGVLVNLNAGDVEEDPVSGHERLG